MKDLGIYIHIPFCKSKCFYCDFYSKPECTNSNIEEYIDTICMELLANSELLQERNITIDSNNTQNIIFSIFKRPPCQISNYYISLSISQHMLR